MENYVDENIRDFNYTYLEDSEDFPVLLKNRANTPPVMSGKRFILARTSGYFTEKQEKDELIVSLFKNYPGTTITVILVDGKLKNTLKTVKAAEVEIVDLCSQFANWINGSLLSFKKREK